MKRKTTKLEIAFFLGLVIGLILAFVGLYISVSFKEKPLGLQELKVIILSLGICLELFLINYRLEFLK